MTIGTVAARSGLNFRRTPGGERISLLPDGTTLEILEHQRDWLQVQVDGQVGFVSARFVTRDADDVTGERGRFRFEGKDALSPDGRVFAKRFRKGVFNSGTTSIGAFVRDHRADFPDVSPSLLRVMEAVSANEGKLEAINTWDNSFITFGAFQWTAGAGSAKGELPALLQRLKDTTADVYERRFGRHGLDVVEVSAPANDVPRGRFSLNNRVLRTAAAKQRLRTLEWAFRFWQAGQDDQVRDVEIRHAMSRVDVFYRNPVKRVRERFVADYVTSEYGVALLLDQHVNRPGHVPRTLTQAVDELTRELGGDDPENWGFAEEQRLLDIYLRRRHRTSMTDSRMRAQRTLDAVAAGLASDQRGSFVL